MKTFFITGTGTDVGKTLVAAIITEALHADYWKPIQAGTQSTDSEWVAEMISNPKTKIHPETYLLKYPASPHIAAQDENLNISIKHILESRPSTSNTLVVEGAGGLMVPLNKTEFVIDLAEQLGSTVIIVSRNYLGSINHSLLTASALKARNIPVMGWIFNDEYLDYETEIVEWSGYPWIASIRNLPVLDKGVIHAQSIKMKEHFDYFKI